MDFIDCLRLGVCAPVQAACREPLAPEEAEVTRRRGFFAEMQHQARVAEQRRQAALRQRAAAQRRSEQARRAAERAHAAAARASDAERKRLEREAAQAHVAARQEEVEELNAQLAATYAELDEILTATLQVDDFVDLEALRETAEHPPFPYPDLLNPTSPPEPIREPATPSMQEPAPVSGIFGRKKKAADAAAAAEQQYARDYEAWRMEMDALPARQAAQAERFQAAERHRLERLTLERVKYLVERAAREREVAAQNAELDELISGLAYGVVEAVQEYVGIVTANSVYPDLLPVAHTATFQPDEAELTLHVRIPGPETIPTIRSYRYVKASDEILETAATQKEVRERYASILHNVALRSLHEVFEADRRGLIRNISLEVGSDALHTATGRVGWVPLLAVTATREAFEEIDLNAVVPAATLEHLNATVSKNPHALTPIALTGVKKA